MISGVLQNASWLVTDRTGGTSQEAFAFNNLAVHVGDEPTSVAGNRARLEARLGRPIVFSRPAHSNRVHHVTGPGADVSGVDALITDRTDLAIAALGADCAMVALAVGGWVAAIHCGWRGLVSEVVPATLDALEGQGADLRAAQAHLGPAICGRCYAVDESRAMQVRAVCESAVVTGSNGLGVDVRVGIIDQLAGWGISATWDRRCTAEDPALYSYRRDGHTGRQAIVVARESS